MRMFPMVPNGSIHESNVEGQVVLLIGVMNRATQITKLPEYEGMKFEYMKGGQSLGFAFMTVYLGKKIISDVRVLSDSLALESFKKEFLEKLPEFKDKIDQEIANPSTSDTVQDV